MGPDREAWNAHCAAIADDWERGSLRVSIIAELAQHPRQAAAVGVVVYQLLKGRGFGMCAVAWIDAIEKIAIEDLLKQQASHTKTRSLWEQS